MSKDYEELLEENKRKQEEAYQLRDFILEINREMGVEVGQPNSTVLFHALSVMSKALDDLITECLEDGGPDHRSIAKYRGYLPPYCKNAYIKK